MRAKIWSTVVPFVLDCRVDDAIWRLGIHRARRLDGGVPDGVGGIGPLFQMPQLDVRHLPAGVVDNLLEARPVPFAGGGDTQDPAAGKILVSEHRAYGRRRRIGGRVGRRRRRPGRRRGVLRWGRLRRQCVGRAVRRRGSTGALGLHLGTRLRGSGPPRVLSNDIHGPVAKRRLAPGLLYPGD